MTVKTLIMSSARASFHRDKIILLIITQGPDL